MFIKKNMKNESLEREVFFPVEDNCVFALSRFDNLLFLFNAYLLGRNLWAG